jgi:hypothetical protein
VYRTNLARLVSGVSLPYHIDDGLHAMVIMIEEFPTDFLIIPIEELVKRGYISTATSVGKRALVIPPPNYRKPGYVPDDWMMPYWNRWELLR